MDAKDLILNQLSSNVCYKLEDYFLCSQTSENAESSSHRIVAFNKLDFKIQEPRLTNWDFLDQKNIENLMNMECQKEIKQFMSAALKKSSKGRPKEMFIHLMMSAQHFSKNNKFDAEQTGSLLSLFYLTHLNFTSDYDISPEKVYIYFKDLLMCHSIPFPPSSKKIFSIKEAKYIIEFFGKIYLRNLPLISYLCLPNFALYLNYGGPPEPCLPRKKDKANNIPKKSKVGKKKRKI